MEKRGDINSLLPPTGRGTDRLGAEKGKNLKFENFFLPLFCVIFGKKNQEKWIKRERFQSIPRQKKIFCKFCNNFALLLFPIPQLLPSNFQIFWKF